MAFTVTATQAGTSFTTGVGLQVEVLTGTAAVQNGASAASSAAYQVAITTTTTGSVVYGALAGSSASLSPNGLTTIINQAAQGSVQYGACKATSATGTPGSTTLGATNTYLDGGVALFEILPDGTITLDGSTPAFASANASSVTTASFNPPPGSLLVALVTTASTLVTISDTSGLGLTWTQQSFMGADGVDAVYTARMPGGASGSMPPLMPAPGWHPGPGLPGLPGGTPFYAPFSGSQPPPAPPPPSGTVQPPATRQVPRLVPQRARIGAAGLAAAGLLGGMAPAGQAPPVTGVHTAPGRGPQRARTGPRGLPGAGNLGLYNRLQITPQPHPAPPRSPAPLRARLGPAGGPAGGVTGANAVITFVAVGPPAWKPQPRSPAPRRAVARGNAGLLNHGAAGPPKQVTQPRRGPGARALWRGIAGTTLIVPGVAVPAPKQKTPPRRPPGARALWRGVAGTVPVVIPPAVAGTWTGGYAQPGGFAFPFPAARGAQIPVTNTSGDWLFALVTWRQNLAGDGNSMVVADDAHNWWEPLGAPSGDSSAAGQTRTAIWYAPAARVANPVSGITNVMVSPTGPVKSFAARILDVSGLSKWVSLTAITPGYANAASALSPGIAAPASQAFVLAALGTDNQADTISGPGAGWTSLGTVTENNGTDHTGDIQLNAAWQLATGAVSAAWSSSGSLDLSGVTGGVLVTAAAPAQPNPQWPVVITELAPGAGPGTPPSQVPWVPISPRSLDLSVTQGRQYTLGQLQAGQGTMTLDNPDGALIPPGTPAMALQWNGDGVTANPGAQSQFITGIVAGQLYQATALFQSVQGWATTQMDVNWFTAGGSYISTGAGPLVNVPAGTPAQVATGWLSAPATAAKATVVPQMTGTPASPVIMQAAAGLQPAGALTAQPLTWSPNNNAAITALGAWTASFPGIDSGTPVRQRWVIPASPTPWYVPFNGFFQRWPFQLDTEMLRGQSKATVLDAWAYGGGTLNSMAREELKLDGPYALWPLGDPAGSTTASNLAPGNQNQLILTASKNGTPGATEAFGANSGAFLGDTSAQVTSSGKAGGSSGTWSQALTGTSQNTQGYGYALVCADSSYPAIAGGVTIEGWFEKTSTITGFTATTTGSLFTGSTGYPNGTPVVMSVASGFTIPGGFATGTLYYVISSSGNNFQLSATLGGTAITVTSGGGGFIQNTTPWHSVIWSARSVAGPVIELDVDPLAGNLVLLYRTQSGSQNSVIVNSTTDFRVNGWTHVAVIFSRTAWTVIVDGGALPGGTGTFASQLPPAFTEFDAGGIMSSRAGGGAQGFAWTGNLALLAVYPSQLTQARIVNHYYTALAAMRGEAACDRIERLLEYGGLTGRRVILQQAIPYEGDLAVSGQDAGGQAATSSIANMAASTLPAMMYVAPTGDTFYLAKYYTWNQPVKWVLGDNTAGGEIPFLLGFATDYDPARVVNDIQLTQLDTSIITVPSAAALEAASREQYGDIPYQATGYLELDASAPYTAGGGLGDLADWLAYTYVKPRQRVQAVTIEAASRPSSQAFVAGVSVGDMVTCNLRPPTGAYTVSVTGRVTQTSRSLKFSQEGVTASVTCVLDFAAEYNVLTCDDAVRGILGGSNVLGW